MLLPMRQSMLLLLLGGSTLGSVPSSSDLQLDDLQTQQTSLYRGRMKQPQSLHLMRRTDEETPSPKKQKTQAVYRDASDHDWNAIEGDGPAPMCIYPWLFAGRYCTDVKNQPRRFEDRCYRRGQKPRILADAERPIFYGECSEGLQCYPIEDSAGSDRIVCLAPPSDERALGKRPVDESPGSSTSQPKDNNLALFFLEAEVDVAAVSQGYKTGDYTYEYRYVMENNIKHASVTARRISGVRRPRGPNGSQRQKRLRTTLIHETEMTPICQTAEPDDVCMPSDNVELLAGDEIHISLELVEATAAMLEVMELTMFDTSNFPPFSKDPGGT